MTYPSIFQASAILCLVAGAVFAQSSVSGTVKGQTVEMTLSEGVALVKNEIAATKPAKVFAFQGAKNNVFGALKFSPPLQGAAQVKVTILKKGSFEDDRDVTYQTGGRTGGFAFTLKPGDYTVEVSDKFDAAKIYLRDQFTVSPDNVGARAIGTIQSGSGTLQICKDVIELKCVGESNKVKAGTSWTAYVTMPQPAGESVTAWVIYRQKADGTDGQFFDSIIQSIEAKFKRWWTAELSLGPGVYTLYSVANQNNQSSEKGGNLKEYFAKTTLTIQ